MGNHFGRPPYKMPRFIREPGDEYRAKRSHYLTSHKLADFRFCPRWSRQKDGGMVPDSSADYYRVGGASHCKTLEGQEAFDRDYLVGGPINPKTERHYGEETKAFREWAALQSKTVISEEQYALITRLDYAVRNHDEASEILGLGLPAAQRAGRWDVEGVLRDDYCGIASQIRVDSFSIDFGLGDLKTCASLDYFENDIEQYEYREQMAFYRAVIRQAIGQTVPVCLIGVEKKEPFRCGVWWLDPIKLAAAEARNEQAIAELLECQTIGYWPTRYENARTI